MEKQSLKELNTLYRSLRKEGVVFAVELHTTKGVQTIKNQDVIRKVLALLIRESNSKTDDEKSGNLEA